MAHQSGYGGSITITGGHAAVAVAVQEWSVRTTNQISEGYAKQESWKTKWPGPCEWQARVACLVQTDVSDGLEVQTWSAHVASAISALALKMSATKSLVATTALITNVEVEDPLDGPVRQVITLDGDAAITPTFA